MNCISRNTYMNILKRKLSLIHKQTNNNNNNQQKE